MTSKHQDALDFLSLFPHRIHTLGYLQKGKGLFSFPVVPEKLPKALSLLEKRNSEGAEIYFMVNEGDGVFNAKKTACHSSKNVTNLSAIFIDAELSNGKDPLPAIKKFCKEKFYEPAFIIETAPHRYHIYWLLQPTPATQENILRWKTVQNILHLNFSSDTTMTDTPQVLRIPTFTNNKRNTKVKVIKSSTEAPLYSLETIYGLLSGAFPDSIQITTVNKALTPLTDETKIVEGNRHEELLRRVRKQYSKGENDTEVRSFAIGFVTEHFENAQEFLPKGSRYEEFQKILRDAKNYHEKEQLESAQKTLTKISKGKRSETPFSRDPDFYYQAPGIVGEITRHITDNVQYPLPSHAFAIAAAAIGTLKSRYTVSPNNLPPLNYFLCLAPSGSGKTQTQSYILKAFKALSLSHYIQEGIASAQGILSFLASTHGLGLILYDEVKDLFQTISAKNAKSYEFRISTELTRLYTAHDTFITEPHTKTQIKEPITIHKPKLSFVGFGHPHLLSTLFTKENILEGLLSRFIILNVAKRADSNDFDVRKSKTLPASIIDQLRYYATKAGIAEEQELINQLTNLTDQLSNAETADEKQKLKQEAKSLQSKISTQNEPERQTIPFDPEALKILRSFDQECSDLYDRETASQTGLEALFSRGPEQVTRLALTLSETSISAPVMQFSVDLIRSQILEFHSRIGESVNTSSDAKETDRLYSLIVHLAERSSDGLVLRRDLQRSARFIRDSRSFNQKLKDLEEMERIAITSKRLGSGRSSTLVQLLE